MTTGSIGAEGEPESGNPISMEGRKRANRLTLKGLKLLSPSPVFLAAVTTALRDFHVHILTENMFPNELDARNTILASVQGTCEREGVAPFQVTDQFYKSVRDDLWLLAAIK
jgi:hypothetical protein